jgi:isoleucyl-tRNA synthetase
VAEEGNLLVALDTELDEALAAEGLAREVAHRLQTLRKAAGYAVNDRIAVAVGGDDVTLRRLEPFRGWLAEETLATSLDLAPEATLEDADRDEELVLDGGSLRLAMRRAAEASRSI